MHYELCIWICQLLPFRQNRHGLLPTRTAHFLHGPQGTAYLRTVGRSEDLATEFAVQLDAWNSGGLAIRHARNR